MLKKNNIGTIWVPYFEISGIDSLILCQISLGFHTDNNNDDNTYIDLIWFMVFNATSTIFQLYRCGLF